MTFTDDRHAAPAPVAPQGGAAFAGPGAAPGHAVSPTLAPVGAVTAMPAQGGRPGGPAPVRPIWEHCDRCQSPVDRAQRYCVVCGTHQRRPDDPAARFFAAARRPKIAPAVVAPNAGRTVSTTIAALLIALLPVAAGIGVVVGRGSADSGDQIVEALKAARGTQSAAAAGGGAGLATTDDAAAAAGDEDAKAAKDKAKDGGKVEGIETSTEQAPILATGPSGSARKLEGSKPTKKDIAESKDAVEKINSSKGQDYIDQQRGLPDTIVIP